MIISILGCGWLGLPLAEALTSREYLVNGSTTSVSKLQSIKDKGVSPYLVELSQGTPLDKTLFLKCDTLIITLPFRRLLTPPTLYLDQLKLLMSAWGDSPPEQVIFTSSTSIYSDFQGHVSESSPIVFRNERQRVLADCEAFLQDHFNATIVRLAGLYGPGREIGKLLQGKTSARSGNSPVNLIHLDDAVEILCRIVEHKISSTTLNAVSDAHPLRSALYPQHTQFSEHVLPANKVVSNQKVKDMLGFSFKFPDPREA